MYLPQIVEPVRVALFDLHVVTSGIPSVAIKDESDMLWYRSGRQDGYEGVLGLGGRRVGEPGKGLRDELG